MPALTTQADLRRKIRLWEITRAAVVDRLGNWHVPKGSPIGGRFMRKTVAALREALDGVSDPDTRRRIVESAESAGIKVPQTIRKTTVPKVAKAPAKKATPRVRTREGARGIEGYRQRLRGMDDAGLEASLQVLDAGTVPFATESDRAAARRAVLTEMRRRDRAAAKVREHKARYAVLLDEGHDELAAWALAAGQDPDRARARMERLGRTPVRQLRRDWELMAETEFLEAEGATRGQMTTPEGRARGIDPREFWRRNPDYVARWASEEFQRWAAERGGYTTFAAYRAMVEGHSVRDVRARESRRLGEFA